MLRLTTESFRILDIPSRSLQPTILVLCIVARFGTVGHPYLVPAVIHIGTDGCHRWHRAPQALASVAVHPIGGAATTEGADAHERAQEDPPGGGEGRHEPVGGGRLAAREQAMLNGLSHRSYLKQLLAEMPDDDRLRKPGRIDRYLPWSEGVPAYRRLTTDKIDGAALPDEPIVDAKALEPLPEET